MEDIYTAIQPLLASYTLYSNVPDETKVSQTDPYLYLQRVTDQLVTAGMSEMLLKQCRFSITIVSGDLASWETYESQLSDINDEISLNIERDFCNKIDSVNGIGVYSLQWSTLSPILYNVKNRPYMVKDFILQYEGNG